jgi:hypothetical protein
LILIFSDSQAALKVLSSPKVTLGLGAECLDALTALARQNEVTLMWVPGHCGIFGNEKAEKLARQEAAMPLLSPEPAPGIPRCSAKEAIKNWIECQHCITWNNLPGHGHGKLFISGPCKKRAEDLLKLSRHQLRLADFAGWRLKLSTILFVAARRWLVSAVSSLGSSLLNQTI